MELESSCDRNWNIIRTHSVPLASLSLSPTLGTSDSVSPLLPALLHSLVSYQGTTSSRFTTAYQGYSKIVVLVLGIIALTAPVLTAESFPQVAHFKFQKKKGVGEHLISWVVLCCFSGAQSSPCSTLVLQMARVRKWFVSAKVSKTV